jgi:hypothetical protein
MSLPVALCFLLIGSAWVATLWVGLYRLLPIALVLATLLLTVTPARWKGQTLMKGLLIASPVYVYSLLSTAWAPDPGTALRDATLTCVSVFPAIAFGLVLARRYSLKTVAFGVGLFILPFAIQVMINALRGAELTVVGQSNIMRSILGGTLCFVMPVVAGAYVATRRWSVLALLLVGLVLTVVIESRTAVLFALPAALLSMWLQDRRFTKRLLLSASPLLLVGALLAGPTALNRFGAEATKLDVGESVLDELTTPPEDRVDFERRLTNFTAIGAFLDSPIIGRGYSAVHQINVAEYGIELSAHGVIPGTLAELGVVGVGIFALTLWRVQRAARHAARRGRDPMLMPFIVGFFSLIGMGVFHQLAESVFFGLALGLLIGMGLRPLDNPRKRHARNTLLADTRALAQ